MGTPSGRLLLRDAATGMWRAPATTTYQDEAALQSLIESSPQLLTANDTATAMAVSREFYVPATGPIDIVAVDPEGEITLVECKLRANPEIRRHVIGQLLAYASGIWRMTYDEFDRAFSRRVGSLVESVKAVVLEGADWDEASFRDEVTRRVEQGEFRLIIAVDSITDELKRVVEYANSITRRGVEVVALELRYVADANVEILIPSTYGSELAAAKPAQSLAEYGWDDYADLGIPSDRINVGHALAERLEQAVAERGVPWVTKFRKGYIAIQRPGGYNVAIVDLYFNSVPRFAVKLPAPPESLGLTDPYGGTYRVTWLPGDGEWGWTIPTTDQLLDVRPALELAAQFHPASGPMVIPAHS